MYMGLLLRHEWATSTEDGTQCSHGWQTTQYQNNSTYQTPI